ncbi:MotA/TolQ/ExbB proton channel family protein [Vibrio sp. RC27]
MSLRKHATLTLSVLSLFTSSLFASFVLADTSALLATTEKAKVEEQALNKHREAEFLGQEQNLTSQKNALTSRKNQLQQEIDALSEEFSLNEEALSEKEKELHLESGSLGELFGVVRQVAKELQLEQKDLVTSIGSDSLKQVDVIVEAKTLPSTPQLMALWQAFDQQIEMGSSLSQISVPYVEQDGVMKQKDVVRIGAFGLVDENGYLQWNPQQGGAKSYSVQPQGNPVSSGSGASLALSKHPLIALDPSKGELLEQLAQQPTLGERLAQGGVVGRVILAILFIGLVIGVAQGGFLFISRSKIRAQLKNREEIGNNPLGRVLSVYKYDQSPNVEALELRLYEAILDEQHKFERGLSMLKLLAALSPMLGLLGTVTGMIETFQVITQYGNADPRIMAGGISTALVTTVLGLVSAMPLLFIHNVLSSQSEHIRTLLEKQGVGMVAQRAEQDMGAA